MAALLDGLRILLAEDESLIALDVETICLDHGAAHIVLAANHAALHEEGLAGGIDAAILDLMLEGVPTLDFAARLQEAGIPFIFASGHMLTDEIESRFPHAAMVQKPYAGDDLVKALAAACNAAPFRPAGPS